MPVMTDVSTKQWYIVHTYSGFEKKVSESLKQRAKAYGLEDQIGRMDRRIRSLERQAELNHGERHFGLDAYDDGFRAAQVKGVCHVTQCARGKRINHVEHSHIDDHAAGAEEPHLVRQVVPQYFWRWPCDARSGMSLPQRAQQIIGFGCAGA